MSRYALFIDADNVPATVISRVISLIKDRGRIVISKVFGDFSCQNLAPWKEQCLIYNLDAILAWRKSGKNSSDMKFCQHCVHTMYTNTNIQSYVLVTGDGDFTTVVQDLKQHEKEVIVMAYGSSSAALRNCCDEFIDLTRSVSRSNAGGERKSTASGTKSSDRKKATKNPQTTIKEIILDEFSKKGNKIMSSRLKERLLCLDSGFNENNFGYNSWTNFLRSLDFEVRIEGSTAFCFK